MEIKRCKEIWKKKPDKQTDNVADKELQPKTERCGGGQQHSAANTPAVLL